MMIIAVGLALVLLAFDDLVLTLKNQKEFLTVVEDAVFYGPKHDVFEIKNKTVSSIRNIRHVHVYKNIRKSFNYIESYCEEVREA